jgi:xylulokinase
VLEGTSFALRDIVESLNECASLPEEIRCVGGSVHNSLWNQIRADILQFPLHILEFKERGCLGAALLAGMGIDLYESFEDAVGTARSIEQGHIVEPDGTVKDLYDRAYSLYKDTYPAIREIMHALAAGLE